MPITYRTEIIPADCVAIRSIVESTGVFNAVELGRLVGAPYVPISAYLLPVPLPVQLAVHYGEPMRFDGTGNEDDKVIESKVELVKARIADLIEHGERVRAGFLSLPGRP